MTGLLDLPALYLSKLHYGEHKNEYYATWAENSEEAKLSRILYMLDMVDRPL
jgi:hypothetical protein